MILRAALLIVMLAIAPPALAQGPARIDLGASSVTQRDAGWWQRVFGPRALDLSLAIDQAVRSGELDEAGDDLSRLVGRRTTPLEEGLRAALAT